MIDEQQFGELKGLVTSIKENTDRIPALATKVALHEQNFKVINRCATAVGSFVIACISVLCYTVNKK